MKMILIASPLSGCGKTTIALQLAQLYLLRGERPMLVDYSHHQSLVERVSNSPALNGKVEVIDRVHNKRSMTTWLYQIPSLTTHLIIDAPAEFQGREFSDLLYRCDTLILPIDLGQWEQPRFYPQLEQLFKNLRAYKKRLLVVVTRHKEESVALLKIRELLALYRVPIVAKLDDFHAECDVDPSKSRAWDRIIRLLDSDLVQFDSASGTPMGRRLQRENRTSQELREAIDQLDQVIQQLPTPSVLHEEDLELRENSEITSLRRKGEQLRTSLSETRGST